MAVKLASDKKKSFDRSKMLTNLVNNYKLVPFIDKAIGEGEFEWEYKFNGKESDTAWHPSGHCTPSISELYAIATGEKEERVFPASLLKTFQVGHFWHQYLQWVVLNKLSFCNPTDIERVGVQRWGEMVGPKEALPYHWVRGSGDIAPCSIPGHGDFLVDFKTMGSHDFKRSTIPDWCSAKYECQINIYMDLFGLERGLIVAILKDSPHDMKEFEYRHNQPLIDTIYTKWKSVSEYLDEGLEPIEDLNPILPLEGPIEV